MAATVDKPEEAEERGVDAELQPRHQAKGPKDMVGLRQKNMKVKVRVRVERGFGEADSYTPL